MSQRSFEGRPHQEERVEIWRQQELRALEWLVSEGIIVEVGAFSPNSQLIPPKKYLFSSVFGELSGLARPTLGSHQLMLEGWARIRAAHPHWIPGGFVDFVRYVGRAVDAQGRSRQALQRQPIALLGVALQQAGVEQGYALLQPILDQDAPPRAAQEWRGMSLHWAKESFFELIKPHVLRRG